MSAPHARHDQQSAQNPALDVYWRPGCLFCLRLRVILWWRRVPARWHNIWADRDAAAFVRSVAGGNETVPTVTVAGRAYVNPQPARLTTLVSENSIG